MRRGFLRLKIQIDGGGCTDGWFSFAWSRNEGLDNAVRNFGIASWEVQRGVHNVTRHSRGDWFAKGNPTKQTSDVTAAIARPIWGCMATLVLGIVEMAGETRPVPCLVAEADKTAREKSNEAESAE